MSKNPTKKPLSYSEKLKDPRWQKKRLQIFERDKWKCQNCGESDDTLHVHHLSYKKNIDPWDYPSTLLITLCEKCHKKEHDLKNGSLASVMYSIEWAQRNGYLISDIEYLINTVTEEFKTRDSFMDCMSGFSKNVKEGCWPVSPNFKNSCKKS